MIDWKLCCTCNGIYGFVQEPRCAGDCIMIFIQFIICLWSIEFVLIFVHKSAFYLLFGNWGSR